MPILFFDIIFLCILGLVVGSFLNALLWRLHEGMSLVHGRSMCPSCKVQLTWWELIPVISFLILGGRCRSCRVAISIQYPLVELTTALIFVGIGVFIDTQAPGGILGMIAGVVPLHVAAQLGVLLLFSAILIALFVYDLRWYLLPDIITIPACIVAFGANLFLFTPQPCFGGGLPCLLSTSWVNLLFAAAIGAGFFLFQYLVSHGTWVGGGDIRLGALMGFMLGYPGILMALFLAYMMGSIVGVGLLIGKKKGMKSEVPFGPFLTLATLITLLFQNDILTTLFALGIL